MRTIKITGIELEATEEMALTLSELMDYEGNVPEEVWKARVRSLLHTWIKKNKDIIIVDKINATISIKKE